MNARLPEGALGAARPIAALPIAAPTGGGATTPGVDAPPSETGDAAPLVSPRSSVATDFTIENTCTGEIEILWVNFEGEETRYGRMRPGAMRTMATYAGHIWRLRHVPSGTIVLTTVAQPGTSIEACDRASPYCCSEPASEPTPRDPPTRCSQPRTGPMTLEVQNHCRHAMRLEWVDLDCSVREYALLAPDAGRTQPTFTGHVWRAVNPVDDHLVATLTADETHTTFVIECDE